MNRTTKIILGTTIGAFVAAGGAYLFNLSRFGKNLQVTIDSKVTGENKLFGIPMTLKLSVTPTLKNPTQTKVSISHPYVELRLNESDESPIASSEIKSVVYDINPLSQISLDPITLTIDLKSNIKDIISYSQKVLKEKAIRLYTTTAITVNPQSTFPIHMLEPKTIEYKL